MFCWLSFFDSLPFTVAILRYAFLWLEVSLRIESIANANRNWYLNSGLWILMIWLSWWLSVDSSRFLFWGSCFIWCSSPFFLSTFMDELSQHLFIVIVLSWHVLHLRCWLLCSFIFENLRKLILPNIEVFLLGFSTGLMTTCSFLTLKILQLIPCSWIVNWLCWGWSSHLVHELFSRSLFLSCYWSCNWGLLWIIHNCGLISWGQKELRILSVWVLSQCIFKL